MLKILVENSDKIVWPTGSSLVPFVETDKDTDTDKETVSIKMNIDYTSSKDDKINYKTKSFKVIENFGYNRAAVVKTLCDVYLEIFTAYALKCPLLTNKNLWLFLKVPKGTAKVQFEEAIRYFQNKLLKEYDDEATREILGRK